MKTLIFKKLGYKVHKLTDYLAASFKLKGRYMEHSYYSCILPGKELILVVIQPSDFVPSTEIIYEANPGYSDDLLPNLSRAFMEETDVILHPATFKYPTADSNETLCSFLAKNSFYLIQY